MAHRFQAPFGFGDGAALERLLREVGFREVEVRVEALERRLLPPEESIPGLLASTPVGPEVAALPESARRAIVAEVAAALARYRDGDGFVFRSRPMWRWRGTNHACQHRPACRNRAEEEMTMRRAFMLQCLTGTALALVVGPGQTQAQTAQGYPDRPIQVIIPYAQGGAADATIRMLAPAMGEFLGQPLVLENRTGGAPPSARPRWPRLSRTATWCSPTPRRIRSTTR
ncbi:hypothetical protein ACFQU2_14455 [Siccirubricoccus deserti]